MAFVELDGFGVRTVFNPTKPRKQLYKKLIGLDLDLVSSYSKFGLGDIETGNITPRGDITQVFLEGQPEFVLIDLTPADFAALLPTGPTVDPAKVKVSSADTTADFLEDKIVAGANIIINKLNPGADEELEITSTGGNTLYNANDTIGSGRVATITDTLAFTGGSIRRNVNASKIVEVTQESDFGTVSGGNINLSNDTTYVVRGNVTCSNTLTVNGDNIAIIGLNRNLDKLIYTGISNFINITDYDFTLKDLWLSATTTGSLLIRGVNVTGAGFNLGRTKVLEIVNCQIRNCYDVIDIDGFDLVDISNTLFFYIQAPSIGVRFRDTSKVEISSCELIRWFDESTVPTPSGWATCSMIELRNNNLASYGAVNINGCIIHPQQTQNGIDIGTGSTTGFGTISSNAFINIGLTTGKVFLPEIPVILLPDYSQTATYNYDVFANQGVLNSTSGCVATLSGNGTATTGLSAAYKDIETGANQNDQASVRFDVDLTPNTNGTITYVGTKQIYCSIHLAVTLDSGGNDDTYAIQLVKNGVALPESESEIQFDSAGSLTLNVGTISINYGTLFNNGDVIKMQIKSTGTSTSCTVKDYQLVVRE